MSHPIRSGRSRPHGGGSADPGARLRAPALVLALATAGGCAGAAGPESEPPRTAPTPPTAPADVPARDDPEMIERRRDMLERKAPERADPDRKSVV